MKDSFWFQHDSNARNDARILELRAEMGWEGYGLWWAVVEHLREATDYRLSNEQIGGLAMGLSLPKDSLRQFLTLCIDLGLLGLVDGYFFSPSLLRRMERWDTKRTALQEAGRRGAGKRWAGDKPTDSHPNSQAIATPLATPMAIREDKSTVERSTNADSAAPSSAGPVLKADKVTDFDSFWQSYHGTLPKRSSKSKSKARWQILTAPTRALILAGLSAHRADATRNGPDYLPYATTFLSEKRWESETYGQAPALTAATRPPAMIPDDPCSLWGAPNPDYDHRNYNQTAGQYTGTVQ